MNEKKTISVDESRLKSAALTISEQAEGFRADLNKLYGCFEELPSFWSGEAADAYLANLSADLGELENLNSVFGELAGNYSFALNEYEKRAYRTMNVVQALDI